MKRVLGIFVLVLMLLGTLWLPGDNSSKARFTPVSEAQDETSYTWTKQLPTRLIDDGRVTNGGDGMATTGWLRKSSGQTVNIDLRGKTLMGSPRLRFRGVGATSETTEYKTSAPNTSYFEKSGGVWAIDEVDAPPVPAGYTFDRVTATATVTSIGSLSGAWEADVSFYDGPYTYNSGTGVSGSASRTETNPYYLTYALLGVRHEHPFRVTFSVSTRGKKVTTVTTVSESPSCGGASSGDLANGIVSSWYNISLNSDALNSLMVSVGGSGQVDVEVEYYTKAEQSAPSSPSISGLTPSSAILTSDAGSRIVCNGEDKVSGSTWSGLSEQTQYSAYAYKPETADYERSPNSPTIYFTTPSSAGPPSVQTRPATGIGYTVATIAGNVSSANGDTPERFLRWGYSAEEMVQEIPLGEGTGEYSIELSGLESGTTYYYQAYATNIYGTGNGAVLNFQTPYPSLEAPVHESPADGDRLQDRRPWLTFTLTAHPENPAAAYEAKARISEFASMSPVYTSLDSASAVGEWQYWDGAAWLIWPAGGVPPGTRVRCRPAIELPYRAFYWDCAAYDGAVWGANSTPWSFRVLIAVTRTFSLVINDQETVGIKGISASETCNGSLGKIIFSLTNKNGEADVVNFNDIVILGINDRLGNVDEFRALVREKLPISGKLVQMTCITGDGILAERIIKQDYPAQDIGQSLKHAVDTYCAPLTSVNIKTTGIIAPLPAKGMNVLQLFEMVRRDYNQFYLVDNLWGVRTFFEEDILSAVAQIQYGANGVTMAGVM